MMIISEKPVDGASALAPLICAIEDCDPAAGTEVEVRDLRTGRAVGGKRLRGAQGYRVDIAPYVRELLDPAPCAAPRAGLVEKTGHTARVEVAAGEALSGEMLFTAACARPAAESAAHRGLRTGESCEAGFFAPEGARVAARAIFHGAGEEFALDLGSLTAGKDMLALVLPHDDLRERLAEAGADIAAFEWMEALAAAGGEEFVRRRYTLARPLADGVRLSWVDPAGGIDAYTFAPEGSETILRDGGALGREWELASDYLCDGEERRLRYAAASPRVWMVAGAECVPVEITGGKVSGGRPGRVTLTVRMRRDQIIPRLW